MKTTTLATLIVAALGGALTAWSPDAAAWASANRFGGRTAHTPGDTAHENRWGGSSQHVAGEGTEHTNAAGGSTEHSVYGGTENTSILATVRGSIPNRRAASRRLRPSIRTEWRTCL